MKAMRDGRRPVCLRPDRYDSAHYPNIIKKLAHAWCALREIADNIGVEQSQPDRKIESEIGANLIIMWMPVRISHHYSRRRGRVH